MKRFLVYTFLWMFCIPLFFFKNRGHDITERNGTWAFSRPGTPKKIFRLIKKGKVFTAIELFWSRWNPMITAETTQPLWKFCQGHKYPAFATLVTFLYSALILHWLYMGITWLWIYKIINGDPWWIIDSFLSSGIYSFVFYMSFGVIIALRKVMKR